MNGLNQEQVEELIEFMNGLSRESYPALFIKDQITNKIQELQAPKKAYLNTDFLLEQIDIFMTFYRVDRIHPTIFRDLLKYIETLCIHNAKTLEELKCQD